MRETVGTAGVDALRSRRLRSGVVSGLLSKGLAMVGPLVVVPLMVSRFGIERYGVWATAGALISSAVFADCGLGSGLLTRLTESVSRDHCQESRDLVATALAAVTAISFVLSCILWLSLSLWSTAGDPHAAELLHTLFIVAMGFALNLPLSLIHRVELAYQSIVASNVWQALGSAMSVLSVVVVISAGGGFHAAVLASALGVPGANALNWLWFSSWRQRRARLWAGRPNTKFLRPLLSLGVPFLLVNGLAALTANGDLLIVSQLQGFADGGLLSVALRYMGIANVLTAAVSMAYWPSAGDALARGDVAWIRGMTTRTALWATAGAVVLGFGLAAMSPWLVTAWLGSDTTSQPDAALLLTLAAWFAVQAFFAPHLALLSAAGLVWRQVAAFAAYLTFGSVLKLAMVNTVGAVGVMLASASLYFAVFGALIFGSGSHPMRSAPGSVGSRNTRHC